MGRVELPRVTPLEPKSSASTSSATLAQAADSATASATMEKNYVERRFFTRTKEKGLITSNRASLCLMTKPYARFT